MGLNQTTSHQLPHPDSRKKRQNTTNPGFCSKKPKGLWSSYPHFSRPAIWGSKLGNYLPPVNGFLQDFGNGLWSYSGIALKRARCKNLCGFARVFVGVAENEVQK
jgi:hypothetical protein